MTIYKLARAMVKDESYSISPAMCTRVAIMVRLSILMSQHRLNQPTASGIYLVHRQQILGRG